MNSADPQGTYSPVAATDADFPLQHLPPQADPLLEPEGPKPEHNRNVSSASTDTYTPSYATSILSIKGKQQTSPKPGRANDASPSPSGRRPGTSKWQSFFRSVGLKSVAYWLCREEVPKAILQHDRKLALTRITVHILPFVITLFLYLFNGIVLLNGPDVSVMAKFWLQVAAKLHELLIVASLTSIALDLLYYHLLNDGINLGLLASGLSISSPSWIWSFDFFSSVYTSRQHSANRRSTGTFRWFSDLFWPKVFLIILLVGITVLATLVGPASALLFNPIQIWRQSAKTRFYVAGTQDQLWPQVLRREHAGPEICSKAPIPLGYASCLNGAWATLAAVITPFRFSPIRPGSSLFIKGGSAWQVPPSVLMSTNLPDPDNPGTFGDPDTWTVSPHLATASHADLITHTIGDAWRFVSGINWRRRLRDFGGSHVTIATGSKFPVTRALCGPKAVIKDSSSQLSFPIVDASNYWHRAGSKNLLPGPLKQISLQDLSLGNWTALTSNVTTDHQSRASWLPLPPNTGQGTAALIYLAQNRTTAVGYACVVDARWATGQTMQTDRSIMWSWEAEQGPLTFSVDDSPSDYHFQRKKLFDTQYKDSYSAPIEATQEWLEALAPMMPEASLPGNELAMNSFEALMNVSELAQPKFMDVEAKNGGPLLEHILTLFFATALSRIGLIAQLTLPSDLSIRLDLQPPKQTSDALIAGHPLYPIRPADAPYHLAHISQHKYGTAWSLSQPAQYLAAAILGIHLILATMHAIVLVWWGRTSSAWDSITELVMLAWGSRVRADVFGNVSGGVQSRGTLEQKVRVAARRVGERKRAEIVIIGEDGEEDEEEGVVERIVPGEWYN